MTSGRSSEFSMHRLPDWLALTAAFIFISLAAYRIQLPGLYYDELAFVNAAQGGADNTFIHMRLGSVPFLVFPYMGALKAWIYAPVFRFFGVSALTIRLPAILIGAVTLLIFFQTLRVKLGAVWATIVVWIMAVDPVNLFPSRLDWGPTVLTHFFQAAILALWFSYRDKARPWKIVLICICAGLGFFDRFNLVCFLLANCCRRIFGVGLLVFANVECCGARESEKRFVLLPYWFSDFCADRDYASGRRSASLRNDFPLAFADLRLSCTIFVRPFPHEKTLPGCCSPAGGSGNLHFFGQHSQHHALSVAFSKQPALYRTMVSGNLFSLSLRQRAWLQGEKYNLRGLGPSHPTPRACTQETAAADPR